MGVDLRDRDCEHAIAFDLQVSHDFPSDDRTLGTTDMDFVRAAILMVLMQCSVFSLRRRMSIIARGMDAVSARAKPSWISVQPCASRVDDDVAPEPTGSGHSAMV